MACTFFLCVFEISTCTMFHYKSISLKAAIYVLFSFSSKRYITSQCVCPPGFKTAGVYIELKIIAVGIWELKLCRAIISFVLAENVVSDMRGRLA